MITPDHDADRQRRVQARRPDPQERRGRVLRRAPAAAARSTVSSDVFFYQLGEAARRARGTCSRTGRTGWASGRKTGIDIPGEFNGLIPDKDWRDEGLRRVPEVHREGEHPAGDDARRCTRAAGSSARGRPATTSASRSARATSRRRRCSSPRPTRRSSTAARSCARTSACRSRTAAACSSSRSARRSAAACSIDPAYREAIMAGLHGAATAAGGTSADVFAGSPYRNLLYGKTGTAERQPNPDQSWYACYVDDPHAADRGRHDDRARRLRCGDCGTRGAADPQRVVRCARRRVPRRDDQSN